MILWEIKFSTLGVVTKNGKVQCGKCESCNNRKAAFLEVGIEDKTPYLV